MSETLSQIIQQEIQQHKKRSISFARFVELALYEPRLGYYSAHLPKWGKYGDFVTAPEISPLFAQALGRQCQEVFGHLGTGEILEIGAGTGRMALDLLLFLEQQKALPTRYMILEISDHLRQRQQTLISASAPHLFSLIEWLEDWPALPITGVIVANEVIDAFPVDRFLWTPGCIQEMRVACHSNGLTWCLAPLDSPALEDRLSQ